MEASTRRETFISTESICHSVSDSALVLGGVCWIHLGSFREVYVPCVQWTLGDWVPTLHHRTGMLFGLPPG